nr:hypothetical protein [Tanacetum cinerariifolium]
MMQVNVQFLQQLQPEWSRNKGKEIAKPITPPSESDSEEDSNPEQAQRDKDMQKNLALIAKYFKKIYKPTNNNLRTSLKFRNKNAVTTPRYKNDNQSGQFGSQRTVNVAGARENVSSPVVQQSGIQCFNCKEFGHFAKECRKPKKVKDSTYHKEKMLLCKQVEKELKAHYSYMEKIQEVPIADSGTNSEPLKQVQYNDEYNVLANVNQHCEQSESTSNTSLVEQDDSDVTPDSPDMCEHDIQTDQNAEDEHDALANLTANLKLDVDENKKIQKQLKKANTPLAHELEQCKSILAETSKTLEESNSVQDSCLVSLQTKQTEFEKYKACNDRTFDYDKLEILRDKIICDLDKTPDLSQRSVQNCPKCGNPIDGHYYQGCALLRKKFKEDLFTYCIENRILQDFSKPSNDNTNVANAPREPFVGNQDPGKNSSQSPPQINHHCCYGCGDPLEDIFCHQCTSLRNHDSSIISSPSKIDSLFDEFVGELTLLKSIPPGIDEPDCDHEEETRFIQRLLYDNSSPRPLKEFVSENSDAVIESFSLSPIPVEDSDSLMEEIDLSFTLDYPIPSGIEEDDYDSERDIPILDELISNDSLSLPKNESFYFDIPSFSRPPAKPPDGNTRISNVKVMGDIFEQKVHMPRLMITLVPNQEKSPDLLSHQGHEAFQSSAECPMMIHGKNTPILDVPLFHFYPP